MNYNKEHLIFFIWLIYLEIIRIKFTTVLGYCWSRGWEDLHTLYKYRSFYSKCTIRVNIYEFESANTNIILLRNYITTLQPMECYTILIFVKEKCSSNLISES